MTTLSGFNGLVRGVRAYFENVAGLSSADLPIVATFGKGRDRKDNMGLAGRVCFMPGVVDPSTGEPRPRSAGRIDRAGEQNVTIPTGQEPPNDTQLVRALAWWHYAITVAVFARDADDPQDEEKQIEATENLVEIVHQAICQAVDPTTNISAGFGNIEEFGEPFWVTPPLEQAYGRELWIYCTLFVPILDVPPGLAYPSPVVNRGES